MTPTQKQFGGAEKIVITIELEIVGCHPDDVIDPVRDEALIKQALVNHLRCVSANVSTKGIR